MNVILKWGALEQQSFVNDSFVKFLPLLYCFELPALQLYALWSINNVCPNDREILFCFLKMILFYIIHKHKILHLFVCIIQRVEAMLTFNSDLILFPLITIKIIEFYLIN